MLYEYVHTYMWFVLQVSDARLTELAARVDHLHKSGESSITQEMIPADVVLTLDTVSKDLSRCVTSVLCWENDSDSCSTTHPSCKDTVFSFSPTPACCRLYFSLRKILLLKMQECSEATATWMRRVIVQLHQWSQMVRTEPSVPSQV